MTSGSGLPSRARVVVIGGGIIGASVAYHLGHMGWGSETLLLERFASGAVAFGPALASSLADRGTDPYAAARQLIAQTIRKEYSDDLA